MEMVTNLLSFLAESVNGVKEQLYKLQNLKGPIIQIIEVETLATKNEEIKPLTPKGQRKPNNRKSRKKTESSVTTVFYKEDETTIKLEEYTDRKSNVNIIPWLDQNGLPHNRLNPNFKTQLSNVERFVSSGQLKEA